MADDLQIRDEFDDELFKRSRKKKKKKKGENIKRRKKKFEGGKNENL